MAQEEVKLGIFKGEGREIEAYRFKRPNSLWHKLSCVRALWILSEHDRLCSQKNEKLKIVKKAQ